MAEERTNKLRLPVKLAFATVGLALSLAATGCGDDDEGPSDAAPATDTALADAGRDAGPDSGLPVA